MPRPTNSNTLVRAASEFVTIVVGVLVALGVSNWASARDDRTDEIRYLEQLAAELRRDSQILTIGLVGAERGLAALERLDSVASGAAPFPSDTMALLLDVLAGGRGGQMVRLGTRTTVDELVSTGSLRLLESASLRSAIVGYYGDKDLAERKAEATRSGYPELVSAHLPVVPSGALVSPRPAGLQEDLFRSHSPARAARIMAATGFQEAITGQQNYLRLLAPLTESLLTENQALTTAVETELTRLR